MRIAAIDRLPNPSTHRTPWSIRLRSARRRPAVHWSVAAVLTFAATVWVQHTQAEIAQLTADGELTHVWVADRDLATGTDIDASAVSAEDIPRSLLPDGAATSPEVPVGRLRRDVRRGEILGTAALAPNAASALAAMLTGNERAIAVPLGPAALTLERGDVVDVMALAGSGARDEPTAAVAAAGARVLVVNDAAATLAVSETEVAAVADALAVGHLSLTLRADSGPTDGDVADQ